jgi:hypothetical protein
MLSLIKCKNILNCNGKNYSNEEVELIRKVLYELAEINVEHLKKCSHEKDGSDLY